MITGYERALTTQQDLGLQDDDLKPPTEIRSM